MSSCVMLISAKYAWYIILFTLMLAPSSIRKRWKTYRGRIDAASRSSSMAASSFLNSGAVIGDRSSRGIQLQQIARVAK